MFNDNENPNKQSKKNKYFSEEEREKRHRQIMTMIQNYRPSQEDIRNLEKVKKTTEMEINLRFMNSRHNTEYRFPFAQNFSNEFEIDEEELPCRNFIFNLHSQTEVIQKSVSTKVLSLDSSRRVKSLERERFFKDERRIVGNMKRKAVKMATKSPNMDQYLIRKDSLAVKINQSSVKLPELKKKQLNRLNMEQVIGRKIVTQCSPESATNKKLNKYLKNSEEASASRKPKKFFLEKL